MTLYSLGYPVLTCAEHIDYIQVSYPIWGRCIKRNTGDRLNRKCNI